MRATVALRAAAVAVVAIAAFAACNEKAQPPVGARLTAADTAEQVLYGMSTVLTNGGIKRGDLVADTAYVYNDQTRFDLRRPKANFTKDDGSPNGTMLADKGMYDMRRQVLEGWGNVVITTVDGRRLESPHLKFDQVANLVTSDTSFVFTQADKRQEGIGFESDPNLRRFSCKRACRGSGIFTIPAQ